MKRFAFLALIFMVCGFSVYAQQPAIQVVPFEVRNGVSAGDAAAVTEIFSAELIKTGKVQVASPPNYQVRGLMTQFAGELVIIVKVIDRNRQIASSTFSRMDNMGQVLGRLPGIAKSLVDQLSSNKNAIRQDYIVKVNPFDLKGEMSAGDLVGITEFIIDSLVNSGVKVAWGNGNEKVNANLRGSVVSLAGQTVTTASIVDNSTNQPVSTATLQLGNISEIYDSKDKSKTSSKWDSFTTALLNVPLKAGDNLFIGKWRGTSQILYNNKYYVNIDLDVRADGTIVVERYESLYQYYKTNAFLDLFDEWKFDREERVTRTGTGTYSSQGIKTIVKLNVSLPNSSDQEQEVKWNKDFSEFSLSYLYNRFVFLNGSYNKRDSNVYTFTRR
jgi:hypothetical protein